MKKQKVSYDCTLISKISIKILKNDIDFYASLSKSAPFYEIKTTLKLYTNHKWSKTTLKNKGGHTFLSGILNIKL